MLETIIADRTELWLGVEKETSGTGVELTFRLKAEGSYVLHWGVTPRRSAGWQQPAADCWPPQTRAFNSQAVQTTFTRNGNGEQQIALRFPAEPPPFLSFVLFNPTTNRWENNGGKNFFVQLGEPASGGSPVADRIVEGEMGGHGWTLMHRFNLCHDLTGDIGDSRDGWVTLFVWLRYSAIRQLTWQRNYNTKPRELSHAQDRLTFRLAALWRQQPANRDLIRLCLTGIGRGGDGQRIRDEILQIMHRHHIKEVGGTWMEQWHQKLHNNTTPDDIVICEAYLAFLQNHGDRSRYHETLAAGGVTRERLANFDRPITNEPEWHPHLRDGLLHDFSSYLKLLKSVHSATDLETAANSAGHLLNDSARDSLNFIRHQFSNPHAAVADLVAGITNVRKNLLARLEQEGNDGAARELLCLDLALDDVLRMVIERKIHSGFSGEQLFDLIGRVLENICLLSASPELAQCGRELARLPQQNRFTPDWSLHAKAALDRLARAITADIDSRYRELQPKAEQLGKAFQAEEWAVKLFAEEVLRGQPAFVLSLLARHFDPILRRSAKLGDWQIISPSTAVGIIEVVETLREVQGRKFERPTLLVARQVHGDEEPPEGARAVITPSSVDLVSHVAVRARNASLLFATCYDAATFDRLGGLKGKQVELRINAAGDVISSEAAEAAQAKSVKAKAAPVKIVRAQPTMQPLRLADFVKGQVGGKSFNLKTLAGKVPGWIRTPRSVALPFGVFDAVLADPANSAVARQYQKLIASVGTAPEKILGEIRQTILNLKLPDTLRQELERLARAEGLAESGWDWNAAATRIKQVWASKWNDRAFFSRQARNFPHDAVQMAVLIQEVISADYAFVLHTTNPLNGRRDELYAEVVRGLGETLVGNYPGRAMSFVVHQPRREATVLAYPGKPVGLFGGGLIFRSDSNAEDLSGYAGAGLYDSVLLEPAREQRLDYTGDRLVWDETFRAEFAGKIADLGQAIEKAFGSPQDIEGAYVGGTFAVVQSRPQVGL
ncbi:MAG: PEP/pyruvate-binding domain-containing protein [Verrucomicrobiota bacterium]